MAGEMDTTLRRTFSDEEKGDNERIGGASVRRERDQEAKL